MVLDSVVVVVGVVTVTVDVVFSVVAYSKEHNKVIVTGKKDFSS